MNNINAPKLLNLSAPTIRNQRKLIWLQKQDNVVNWSKWDAIVTNMDAFTFWSQQSANIVGIVITEPCSDTNTFIDTLFEVSKKVPLVLLSQAVLSLKSQDFWSEHFDNILNLDNIRDQYPFINNTWDGTHNDAIAIFGLLLRYNQIIDCQVSDTRAIDLQKYSIELLSNVKPTEVWMVTQFFRHKDYKRFAEIKECLSKNCQCPHVDKIILINEKDYSSEYNKFSGSKKVEQIVTGKRLTYADFLKFVKENVPSNVFVLLCNADIYFDNAVLDLHKINMNDRMFGLLRWDVDTEGNDTIFGPRADSQDTWIFLSDSIHSRTWDYTKFNFQLGQAGCDNAFAGLILRQKFLISNPALTLKTYHLHNTNIRNYDKKDYIRADIYINIAPTYIIDSKQETVPSEKPTMISNELASFEVKSSSMSNEITYCTMLEKEGRYKWEPSVENFYFQPQIPVYTWNNASVTPNGLVYDLFTIYKGKHADKDEKYNYWGGANVDILTPLQKRDKMFAIPFKNTDVFKHPDIYILNYVSRCVRLLKQFPDTSFWIPPNFSEYIDYFNWNVPNLNAVIFDENTACYADKVIGFLPGPEFNELGQEDIQALRSILPSYVDKPMSKTCAIVLGSSITSDFAQNALTTFLLENDEEWSIRFVSESDYASYDALLGASLCIFVGGKKASHAWSKLWALPKNCCVIEFQQELQIDGEFQHLAHVAGFKSWVLLLSKGSVQDVQEQIVEQLGKWFKKNRDEVV